MVLPSASSTIYAHIESPTSQLSASMAPYYLLKHCGVLTEYLKYCKLEKAGDFCTWETCFTGAHICWEENTKAYSCISLSMRLRQCWSTTCFIFAFYVYLCQVPNRCSTCRKEMLSWVNEWERTHLKSQCFCKSILKIPQSLLYWLTVGPCIISTECHFCAWPCLRHVIDMCLDLAQVIMIMYLLFSALQGFLFNASLDLMTSNNW